MEFLIIRLLKVEVYRLIMHKNLGSFHKSNDQLNDYLTSSN
jgi:hypothetical protein